MWDRKGGGAKEENGSGSGSNGSSSALAAAAAAAAAAASSAAAADGSSIKCKQAIIMRKQRNTHSVVCVCEGVITLHPDVKCTHFWY